MHKKRCSIQRKLKRNLAKVRKACDLWEVTSSRSVISNNSNIWANSVKRIN